MGSSWTSSRLEINGNFMEGFMSAANITVCVPRLGICLNETTPRHCHIEDIWINHHVVGHHSQAVQCTGLISKTQNNFVASYAKIMRKKICPAVCWASVKVNRSKHDREIIFAGLTLEPNADGCNLGGFHFRSSCVRTKVAWAFLPGPSVLWVMGTGDHRRSQPPSSKPPTFPGLGTAGSRAGFAFDTTRVIKIHHSCVSRKWH